MVAIVIVTFNRLNYLKDLIVSIRKQSYSEYKIVVVNNSSTDGTIEYLKEQDDVITITQPNCGGAGGFYTGLKYSAENGFDYVWVMDDDVCVMVDSLSRLMSKTQYCNGFLCGKVVDEVKNPCNLPAVCMVKQDNGESLWNEKSEYGLIRVDTATFVSVLIPISVIKQVGLPYREFFIWGDDVEYTYRISKKYASYYVSDSVVVHRRVQNGILSIVTEKDKKRIDKFFYSYRNLFFYSSRKSFKEFITCFCRASRDLIKCLITFKLRRSYIIVKAFVCFLFFFPQVKFPIE